MVAFILATVLADAPLRDLRSRELLSSVIISGTCARGCSGERRLFGTGEIVARRSDGRLVVLTARHVIADMSDPHVFIRNGMREGTQIAAAIRSGSGLPADVIARSTATDLAFMSFRPAPSDAYAIATFSRQPAPHGGDVVGGPYGALWTVSPYRPIASAGDPTIVACETCGPGDSGGGVFDGRGALAGILVSQQVFVRDDESLATATRSTHFKIVPLGDVRTFVAQLPRETPTAPIVAADPWSRFANPEALPQNSARENPPARRTPWSRFDAPH